MSKTILMSAFIGGAVAGAALGLLLAPQSGAETRKKLIKSKNQSEEFLQDLVEEGKKSWYETKGKAKKSAGIAAEEMDDFVRHILSNGEKLWKKAKNAASEVAEEAEQTAEKVVQNGKRSAEHMAG